MSSIHCLTKQVDFISWGKDSNETLLLYLLFRSTLMTAWEGLSKPIWPNWTQKICSNSAVSPWWRNLISQKHFSAFRIYNLCVKCRIRQEEHEYETDVQSVWYGNSSLYNNLIIQRCDSVDCAGVLPVREHTASVQVSGTWKEAESDARDEDLGVLQVTRSYL